MKVIKNTVSAALVLFFILSLSMSVCEAKQTYKIGIINDYDFADNQIISYAKSSLKTAVAKKGNDNLAYSQYSLSEGLDALEMGNVDFISMVPFDETLTPYVDYTEKPVAIGFLSLLISNKSSIYFEDFKSMNKSRVALLSGSYYEDELKDYALRNRFDYTPLYFDSADDMIKAVNSGEADMALLPATSSPENMRLAGKLGRIDYYCAVKKGNGQILDTLNEAIKWAELENPFYLTENYVASYRIPYQNMMAFTYNDISSVKEKSTVRVYVSNNYPMAFYSIRDGKYEGMYVDILNQIAANAGLNVEYINDDVNDMDITVENVLQGKADILLNVSGTIQDVIKASDPYTTLSYISVAQRKSDPKEEDTLTVGITENNRWILEYLSAERPNWTVCQFKSINSMFHAADRGQIDLALISTLEMQTKTSLIAHPRLEMKNISVDIPVCLGISTLTCPSFFVSTLNNIIKNLYVPTAEFETRAYILSHTYVPNFRDMLYANRVAIIIILIIVALVILLLAMRSRYFQKLARLDRMTELYNGKYFMAAAQKLMQKKVNQKHLLVSIDAKNFKLVNDRFGTDIGDQVIMNMAKEIYKTLSAHALVARLHGDEFLAFMEDTAFKRSLIEELLKIDVRVHNSSDYRIHLKIGVCPIDGYNEKLPMTSYIDKAHIAKDHLGVLNKNDLRYFTYDEAMKLELENEIEVDMQPALKRGEFIAYYQPKYDLKTEKICGAEALVRWNHKDNGMISPGLFVPVLERNGFINEVDFAVYEQTLMLLERRLKYKMPVVKISINVSRTHLTDSNFLPRLIELFEKYNVPKSYVEMEITETIFSDGDNSAKDLVYELKENGFQVSMDDFGSGYSSLNLLRIMPIDTLKIDKVFIEDIETSKRSLTIIEEIIGMAKRININTVCEGIETEGQRDILRDAGCDIAQGYYYSKPLSREAFEILLNNGN